MKKNFDEVILKESHNEIINLLKEKCALNAYEIFEYLKTKNIKNISQTTTYRALNYLVENNIIKPVHLHDGHTRYEISLEENHHHHFICLKCNKLFPLEYCPIEQIEKFVPDQFEIKFHNFEIFGLCTKCQT